EQDGRSSTHQKTHANRVAATLPNRLFCRQLSARRGDEARAQPDSLCERCCDPVSCGQTAPAGAQLHMTTSTRIPSRTWAAWKSTRGYSGMTSRKRHIISLLLQNEVGALTRVTSLFSIQ